MGNGTRRSSNVSKIARESVKAVRSALQMIAVINGARAIEGEL